MSETTKPKARVLAVAITLVALSVAAWIGWRRYERSRPFEWSGTVETRTMSVGSRVGGRVREVLVREGDTVALGTRLVVLEPGDSEAQRLVAEGQLEQAKGALEKLESGARPEEIAAAKARASSARSAHAESLAGARKEQIRAARARLAQSEALVAKARGDAERGKQLFEKGAISQAEFDSIDAQLRTQIAQQAATKAALDELESGTRMEEVAQAEARAAEATANMKLVTAGSRIEDIRAARGAVEAAEGRLKQVLVMLDELVIKAPRDARVESLQLRPGDLLAPSATAATLLEAGQLYVRIYVPETQLGNLGPGVEVPIYVDAYPNRAFKGVVEHMSGIGEYTPRNLQTADERADHVFAARVGVRDGGEAALRAGMAALVRVKR